MINNATSILRQVMMILLFSISANSYATDFGNFGQTFKVAEESFVAMLKKRLESVDIEKEKGKMQAKAKEQVENPIPVRGINPATRDKVFYFDPTYVLDKDIVLPCGKILHKAATKVNPLEHMNFNRRLFFIDGSRKDQVAWLKEQLNSAPLQKEDKEAVEDRVILVGGSVFKLKEELGDLHEDKVYFDQAGELTSKFGINAIPAIVSQDRLILKIDEIKLNNHY
jgi:conjugal transfer pilus assembly protein TraW